MRPAGPFLRCFWTGAALPCKLNPVPFPGAPEEACPFWFTSPCPMSGKPWTWPVCWWKPGWRRASTCCPARSVYRWQGEVREAGECLLLAQVSRAAFEDFCAAVRRAHSYEVPCIVALPLEAGHQPFLLWIEENSLPSVG